MHYLFIMNNKIKFHKDRIILLNHNVIFKEMSNNIILHNTIHNTIKIVNNLKDILVFHKDYKII